MRTFATRRNHLPAATFTALKGDLLASDFVAQSTLGGTFTHSRGFAMIFKAPGRDTLERRFPSLTPHLATALGHPAIRALTPFYRRVARIPNAWYLNLLLVAPGGSVARHVDATLRQPAGAPEALPECVSVLYLSVPQPEGGALELFDGADPRARIAPQENLLVHFRGDLAHGVASPAGPPEARRASLVIEQYHLDDDALGRLPDFQLESRAGFGVFLKAHKAWGLPPTSTLEQPD